jgi:hypothetical protein
MPANVRDNDTPFRLLDDYPYNIYPHLKTLRYPLFLGVTYITGIVMWLHYNNTIPSYVPMNHSVSQSVL